MKGVSLEALRVFWTQRTPQERVALKRLSVVLLLVSCYLLLWAPLQVSRTKLRAALPQERAQLARMQDQAAQVMMLRRETPAEVPAGNLLGTVEGAATAQGLRSSFTRIEPEGTNAVQVQAEEIPFNALVGWLAELQRRSGIRVESASFETHGTAGTVNARLVLRGPGA